jgi:hypothetical protein
VEHRQEAIQLRAVPCHAGDVILPNFLDLGIE